jgi:hypothetical protein
MVCPSRESGDLHTLAGNIPNVGIIIGRKEKVKRENLNRETRGPVATHD